MRVQAAARRFDKTPCSDAYTGDFLFNAQLGLYDDSKRDSDVSQRRILSVDPAVEVPERRVVAVGGVKFILGHPNYDTFLGREIRAGYVAHEATDLATIRTLRQEVEDTPGVEAWAGRAWVKNSAQSEQDSDLTPQHHIHFSVFEVVPDYCVIQFERRRYVVRSSNAGPGGTLVTMCDQIAEPAVDTATLVYGEWNPITDRISSPTTHTFRVLRLRWQSYFEYSNKAAPKFGPDDAQLVLPLTATVKPGSKLTLGDGEWHVASVSLREGVRLCRATRHAIV